MKKLALILVLASLGITSCQKDRFEPKTPETMEQLQVPANFNWKTTKDYQFTFIASQNGLVQLVNNQNVSYQKAFLTAQEGYIMKITLPAYETSVKVIFAGKEKAVNLTSPNLTINLN